MRLWLILGWLTIAGAALAGTISWFVHNDRLRQADAAREAYIETMRNVEDAKATLPDSDDGNLEWLRNFGK